MFKSVFSKYLSIITSVVLVGFLAMTLMQTVLTANAMADEKKELLLENVENTFVTPVFNGSASLRNAAGQMIEEVTKAVRRKKVVDEAFTEELFEDMIALYRLDQRNGAGVGKKDLGPLPKTATALLVTLGTIWGLMGVYVLVSYGKKKRKSTDRH